MAPETKVRLRPVPLEELNRPAPKTLMGALGIQVTAVGDDYVEATMPVDHRTHQVYGLLHGGATVALAETLGSIGAMLAVDSERKRCVGIEINANHVHSVTSGLVRGVARPIHLGRGTQVWDIRVSTEEGRLVSVCRLTVAVIEAR